MQSIDSIISYFDLIFVIVEAFQAIEDYLLIIITTVHRLKDIGFLFCF